MRFRGRFLLAVCAVAAALAIGAAAVQPVYHVDREVIFLPLDGVALNAHTGRVLWRFPRYQGETLTDGHGMLLVSWAAVLQPKLHRRVYRVCRLRTSDGRQLWCRDVADMREWRLDAGGQAWYVHLPGRLEVRNTSDGQADRGFELPDDRELTLMALPQGGALLLRRHAGQSAEALSYRPGAAALSAEDVPAGLYPFQGDGRGLLLYARKKSEFFLAAPFQLLLREVRRGSAADAAFPSASLDGDGFVFTGWQGSDPVLRGGTYSGALWQAPRGLDPAHLALAGTTALALEGRTLRGWDLASGRRVFERELDRGYDALSGGEGAAVLQDDGAVCLVEPASGRVEWRVDAHEGPLAAIASSAVVFWEESGQLAARARANGALLWRVRFAGGY